MEIDTAAAEASGTRGPSPRFIQGRHERMRVRLNSPTDDPSRNDGYDDTLNEEHRSDEATTPSASSTGVHSFHVLRAKGKNPKTRVPGGAAAKLIGKAANEDDTTPMDEEEDDLAAAIPVTDDEFVRAREEAKSLFEKGPKENRRYHDDETPAPQSSEAKVAPAATSRFLNRAEVLPSDPAEAVLSLIGKKEVKVTSTPANKSFLVDIAVSTGQDRTATIHDLTTTPAIEVAPRNVFEAPSRSTEEISGTVLSEIIETTVTGLNPLEQPLLSKKAEQRVAQLKEQMKDPNATLASLIATVATPEDYSREEGFTRGYMVRRKNACGALLALTTKPHNRISVCWTLGVLPALSSVLGDSGTQDLDVEFPDIHIRKEFVEARKRAVGALTNLSLTPQNCLAIFHTPGMVANLVRVIRLDQAEARKGCCGILATLSKAKENRLLMVLVPDLIATITEVIEPKVISESHAVPRGASEDSEDDSHELLHSRSDSSSDNDSGSEPFSSASFDSVEESVKKKTKNSAGDGSNPSSDKEKVARRYNEDPNGPLHEARVSVFVLLSNLVKEKDNAYKLARHNYLIDAIVEISKLQESLAHEHAVKLIAHLTRHRGNSKYFVFKVKKIIPALINASSSPNDETRKYACFGVQNLSQDKPCRQELAGTDGLLAALCVRIRQPSNPEERLSAIQALTNLTNEPANLIPMTNTPECLATLMQIAHAGDDSVTEMMQFLACDALATLSHWFRSIATSGKRIGHDSDGAHSGSDLFVPSLRIVAYEQWQ
jgi:hypothetical protein